jgi:hypothetical protein
MFQKSFKASFILSAEAESEALLLVAHSSRNAVLQKIRLKAHVLHERGVVHVPAPFANDDDDDDGDNTDEAGSAMEGARPARLYAYGGLQSFDRRAFVASLADAYRLRSSGFKERAPAAAPADSIDTMSVVGLFAKVDASGDGGVTREELVKNCHLLNLSVDEAHRLFDKLDVNGDGEVVGRACEVHADTT